MITNIFPGAGNGQARAAVFMSGTGTNAEALFRYHAGHPECRFVPALIVTDAPEHSRARELAAAWNIPLVEHDIRAFYAARGETAISLVSERRRAIRSEWTEALRELVLPWKIDFGVPFRAVISVDVESWEPEECPLCKEGKLPVVKPGSRKV